MSKRRTTAEAPNAPLFAWLGGFALLAEIGTQDYPRPIRRRLAIVNLMAFLIAIFSAIYAAVFAFYGMEYWPLIAANLLLVVAALFVPLAHRINDIAGAILICIAEFIALFFFVRELGHASGIQLNYIIAAAVAFAVCGLARLRLVVTVIAAGLGLHLAAWFLFPPEAAKIAAPPELLANLYISSAATTFVIIALIVGYAFTLADRARAEADALLANILPEPVAERLKERPGERIADTVDEASVLFTDLVGFTGLAQKLGAARTVALLDEVVTEFDELAAEFGVEKIKTIGEAGVIGTDKFSYDVWGETVNLASRLESHGLPGEIHVSGAVKAALAGSFIFEPRGTLDIKGVGPVETWLLKRCDRRG